MSESERWKFNSKFIADGKYCCYLLISSFSQGSKIDVHVIISYRIFSSEKNFLTDSISPKKQIYCKFIIVDVIVLRGLKKVLNSPLKFQIEIIDYTYSKDGEQMQRSKSSDFSDDNVNI